MSRRHRHRSGSLDLGRLCAGLLLSAGAIALGLSFYNPISGASGPPQQAPFALDDLPEGVSTTQTSRLMLASGIDQPPDEAEEATEESVEPPARNVVPTPVATLTRTAAPTGALSASRVRSVSGVEGPRSSSASQASTAPLTIAVTSTGGSVSGVAAAVVEDLKGLGRNVRLTTLTEAGRPHVMLVLDASAGESAYAWYCEPGPASNATLANLLLRQFEMPDSSGPSGPDGPGAGFSCKEVHAGRAQTTAVLLELPRTLDQEAASQVIAAAVDRYLDENAASISRSRQQASMIWPANGPITSHYGPSHPLGIDIAQWGGDIVAALDGKVVFAGGNACCSYGYYVVVESAGGIHTLYAHFSRIDVKVGQTVRQGQALGPVGCTGYCFGTHLHFEVFVNGSRVDPMKYLP